jgi:Fe-S cluster assembly protein SufD
MKVVLLKAGQNIVLKPIEDIQYVLLPSKETSVTIELEKEGVSAELVVPFTLHNNDQVNLITQAHHKVPNTNCIINVRGVLFDKSVSDYVGKIVIDRNAQKTISFLKDDVLSLGEKTKNHSQPILEIEANDVKASHGATTGRVSEDQLYYLMSRGLSKDEAEDLIVGGFFESLLVGIKDARIRKQVKKELNV